MKKLICASAILTSLFLVSCGGDSKKTDATTTDKPAASAVVNESDWELKDLGTGATAKVLPPFAVKLPKDAVITVDTVLTMVIVTFKNQYKMSIAYGSAMQKPEEGLKGQIAWQKDLNVTSNAPISESKMLAEDSTGFAYTSQARADEKTAPVGEITGHFAYFIADKKGGYIQIQDMPNGLINEEAESVGSAANTMKIREIIMKSATFK